MNSPDLDQFTGTLNYYMHWTRRMKYTDGIHYLAEEYGAYWLLDVVASYQTEPKIAKVDLQIWTLVVHDDKSATVTMKDDDGTEFVRQEIEFTDFRLPAVTMWLINGVLILPSEY